MKKFFLTVILILSLLLISCGEKGLPEGYTHTLSRNWRGDILLSGETGETVRLDFSELEGITANQIASLATENRTLIKNIFPKNTFLQEGNDNIHRENEYLAFTFDYNEGIQLTVYVRRDGSIVLTFFLPLDEKSPGYQILSFFSNSGTLSYETAAELLISDQNESKKRDTCNRYLDDTTYTYILRPDGNGNFCFFYQAKSLFEIPANQIETIMMFGPGLFTVFQHLPERQETLPLFFPVEIAFRPFDPVEEYDTLWKDIYNRTGALHLEVDLNDRGSCTFYFSPDGRIVMIDACDHYYITKPGILTEEDACSLANNLSGAYYQKYYSIP